MSTPTSQELFERASRRIPGGVNSPVRAMRSVGRTHPVFVERGTGAYAFDADGNRYTDWVMSWGALPLGHADPDVVAAVEAALRDGSSFGAPTRREVELAELVCELVPSIEMVRFVSSGTEATMSALRLARAATGRDRVISFAGCYHGHGDSFLATGGSGLATLGIPSSPGVPTATAANTLIGTYNSLESVEQLVESAGADTIAAVFVEPVPANMGVIRPDEGFLEGLRALCDRIGALLVFDEVISGFRLAAGGAQERFGVLPDLTCLGKVVGGGLPVGAFGGSADVMQLLAPQGDVYQAGTLSGNPLAMAAGLTTLRAMQQRDGWATLDAKGAELERMLLDVLPHGGDYALQRIGPLLTLFCGVNVPPRNYDEARACNTELFARVHAHALESGHLLPASQFEAWFPSLAHDSSTFQSLAESIAETLQPAPV
jgi:glutamate-1-semialdehyde 2,1-aminomutase